MELSMRQADHEFAPKMKEIDSWSKAVELMAEFCRRSARISHLLEGVPHHWESGRRRACQSLLFGTVRHLGLLEKVLDEFLQRKPKNRIWAALLVASWEIYERPDRTAKVVHNAVGKIGDFAGKSGRGLANAVLRKVAARLEELRSFEPKGSNELAWRYSHPEWRVKRWIKQFGESETKSFLEWNQREAGVFARWQRDPVDLDCLQPVEDVDGFFHLAAGSWETIEPYLDQGRLYVQNPAARLAPDLLLRNLKGDRILDLCAAPGGKSLYIEAKVGTEIGTIHSLDLAGPRFERMEHNFKRYATKRIQAVAADLFECAPSSLGRFAGVLIDVPCSNSGVLQHKIDAKWRQSEAGLNALLGLQSELLAQAALFVEEGGCLVYSTCSVDEEENAGIVNAFLETERGASFKLEDSTKSVPWIDRCDGAGAFLLRKR